jgi:Lrp/AsnC family leucine-responsive transcriptional regulator
MTSLTVYKDYLTFLGKNIENTISCEILSYVRGIDVDEKDEAILKILGRRAGLSSRALSNILDIPISTVHRRVKHLERDGVITGYKALIDYEKTTWPIGALLLIDLAEAVPGKGPIPKKVILSSLRRLPEIEEIIEVQAATFDLVVKARFQSLKKLSDFIEELRSVEGIEETSTAIVTDEQVLSPLPT